MILHNILPNKILLYKYYYKQRILMPIRLLLRFVKIVWPNTHFPIRAAYRHAYIWSIIIDPSVHIYIIVRIYCTSFLVRSFTFLVYRELVNHIYL